MTEFRGFAKIRTEVEVVKGMLLMMRMQQDRRQARSYMRA